MTTDRTTKLLPGFIAILLIALLIRSCITPMPGGAGRQIAVSNGALFVLEGDKLTVYQAESKAMRDNPVYNYLSKDLTLRRYLTQDLSTAAVPSTPPAPAMPSR